LRVRPVRLNVVDSPPRGETKEKSAERDPGGKLAGVEASHIILPWMIGLFNDYGELPSDDSPSITTFLTSIAFIQPHRPGYYKHSHVLETALCASSETRIVNSKSEIMPHICRLSSIKKLWSTMRRVAARPKPETNFVDCVGYTAIERPCYVSPTLIT